MFSRQGGETRNMHSMHRCAIVCYLVWKRGRPDRNTALSSTRSLRSLRNDDFRIANLESRSVFAERKRIPLAFFPRDRARIRMQFTKIHEIVDSRAPFRRERSLRDALYDLLSAPFAGMLHSNGRLLDPFNIYRNINIIEV